MHGLAPSWTQAGDVMKRFDAVYDGAQAEAKATASSKQPLMQLTEAVTNLPENGVLTTGAAAPYRYAVANYANTLSDIMKLGIHVNPEAITSQQEMDKIAAISTQAQSRGMGHQAASWLDTQRLANPNVSLSRQTNNSILAAQWVASAQAKDRASTFEEYGKASNRMGYNAESVYQNANPSSNYVKERRAIEDILNNTKDAYGGRNNAITLLLKGADPKQFDEWAYKNYGVRNLSRVFLN